MALPKLPRSLEVGRGTALFLEGGLPRGDRVAACEVELRGERVPAVAFGLPAPDRLSGAGWWQAIVPLAAVDSTEEVELVLRTRPRGGGWEVTRLGHVRLEPGPHVDRGAELSDLSNATGRVAICLATYDPPLDLLERQLDSILEQSHSDWTCIVSDDASPRSKWVEIERMIGDDERFQGVRAPERAGIYRNFERALRLVPTDAEYVAFSDQDDRWHPEKLEVLAGALEGGALLAHGDARVLDARGKLVKDSLWSLGLGEGDDLSSLLDASAISGASCLFRRELLGWALPFPPLPGTAYHDRWVSLVATALGETVRVDRPLYDYVQHAGSAMGHEGIAGTAGGGVVGLGRKARQVARGELRPDWRSHHDGTLMRTAMEATVLRLRAGDRVAPRERRVLERAALLPGSRSAQAGLLARAVRKRGRPGLEGALARGLAWRRIAALRTRSGAAAQGATDFAGRARGRARALAERTVETLASSGLELPAGLRRFGHVPASVAQDAELREHLRAKGAPDVDGPPVSMIILGAGDPPSLAETAYARWDVSRANDDLPSAIERADGELIVLLDARAEPASPGWLSTMVSALREEGAICVGARLVHPRRPGSARASHPDLTLASRGLHFPPGPGRMPAPQRLGAGEPPLSASASATAPVPGVSAACLIARKSDLTELDLPVAPGDRDELGAEISAKLRARGGRVVYAGEAVVFDSAEAPVHSSELGDRVGPLLFRNAFADRLRGKVDWTETPLRAGITVTRGSSGFGHGDHHVASELAQELRRLGWEVELVELHRERWRRAISDLDVLVVLLDRFPLDEVPRGIVSVAWIRNWTERWLERPWFDDFDLVFTSSNRSKEMVEEQSSKVAEVMPLAVNPQRFRPLSAEVDADVVVPANRWGVERSFEDAVEGLPGQLSVRVVGRGWESSAPLGHLSSGPVEFERMPAVYASARVVVDDSARHARPYGAVNARVFEAIACGATVVSNDAEGVHEIFGDDFPVWSDASSLGQAIEAALANPEQARERTERYRRLVLDQHTYRHRAAQIGDALLRWCCAPRLGVAVGAPNREEAETWGDFHFARSLARALERRGWPTRVHLLADWDAAHAAREDVWLHLFGRSTATTRAGQVSAIWNISHPELVTDDLLDGYDLVLVASSAFAEELENRGARVETLNQATDPERFRPEPGPERFEVLFVGNSLGRDRPFVRAAARSSHRLTVFGEGWARAGLDGSHAAHRVRNSDLPGLYAAADVVLSDHSPEMRECGFISNRVYDALASGACVVSDHVPEIEAEFDGAVATFGDERELLELLDRLMSDPAERAERAERGRAAVLERHTFGHRADRLVELLEPLVRKRVELLRAARSRR